MALQVGESIGHYQIVEEIGAGGNGRVLKVQHLITRRREAMKILANGRPTSQEYAHRVLREIRLQASLDHPNIAAVLNAFWLEDDRVMIMELIDGVTLQKILERRRLNLDQSINLIRQVLIALSYAHSNGVIHRDVSTANIIVNDEGRVKLTDFGLAKGPADLNVTDTGGMVGSPYYISPEQVRGGAATDQRSDIYSTGVVLYELLTGSRPFEAESAFSLMQAHVQHKPQAPIERNPAIPQFINEAVLKAMAKNPWERFQSAAEFLAALEGPVEKPMPLPEMDATPKPAPAPLSHSYAAPLPPEEDPKAKKPLPFRKIITSPAMGAVLGIGVVIAAVAPVMFYDFEAGRPRFSGPSRSASPTIAPLATAPDSKTATPPLVLSPGPKELPTLPQGNGGINARRAAAKKASTAPLTPPPPPKIMVWGDARTAAPANPQPVAANTPSSAPPAAAPVKKMEDPPALAPSLPKAAIEPTVPQPAGAIPQRRGLFRRLASGVRALNPNRKEQSAAVPEKQP